MEESQDSEKPNLAPAITTPGSASATSTCPADISNQDEEPQFLNTRELYSLFGALLLVMLMFSLDISILATAIPRITDQFHTIQDIGWYGAAYMIASSVLQPFTGKIYTYFPVKLSFLGFVALFEFGSLLCATAVSSTMLVIGRAVAGMGSSGLSNGSLTILKASAPSERQPMLMGIIMSMFGAGQVLGPIIGGALTQRASWRWCFYINLPVGGATALCMLLIRIPETGRKKHANWTIKTFLHDFDLIGFSIFAPACVMLLLPLQWGGTEFAWDSATVIGLFCGSAVEFLIFALWERRHGEYGMIPVTMIRRRVIWSSCATAAMTMGGMVILSYYLPLWFQVIQHASPITSAIHTLPTFVSQIVTAIVVGYLVTKTGYFTPYAIAGSVCSAIGSGLMSTFTLNTSAGPWIGYQILAGAGRGLAIQQPIQAVQSSLPLSEIATGTAIVAFCQSLSASVCLALAQTAFTNLLRHGLSVDAPGVDQDAVLAAGATNYSSVVPQASRHGVLTAYNYAITHTYYLAAGLATVAMFTAFGMGWTSVKKAKPKKEETKMEETTT